jgi:hypothetical protein
MVRYERTGAFPPRETGYGVPPKESVIGDINVDVSTGSKEGQKFAADQFNTMSIDARKSAVSVQTIDSGIQKLDSGIISGFAGNLKLGVAKALYSVGLFPGDTVQTTEAYLAQMATEVGRIIELFGAGTGLSDADRDYAEAAAAGAIDLTAAGMKRILEMNRKIELFKIRRYNERLSSWQNSDQPGRKEIAQWFDPVDVPAGRRYNPATGKIE